VDQAALRAVSDEPDPRFGNAAEGEAEAGRNNLVGAFAKPSAKLVRDTCELRRLRGDFLPGTLLGEPVWDILLNLYAAELDQQRMSITRLTRLSGIAATTVLRCLGTLVQAGLVERSGDPIDGRRVFVALSQAGMEAMGGFFSQPRARSAFL
jgi:DNA-binding MarR family transcriptional regulator